MTGRERLVAGARGGETDRQPVIGYLSSPEVTDAIIVAPEGVSAVAGGEQLVLAEVSGPFPAVPDQELVALLDDDPEEAARRLDARTEHIRSQISRSLADGADGILYRLHGANPRRSTPMQYGGHVLERDRELLDEVRDARLNVLLVVGGEDTYFDFVSDLPAHVFAWDAPASGVSSAAIRTMRAGAQASADPQSEIFLHHPGVTLAERLEQA